MREPHPPADPSVCSARRRRAWDRAFSLATLSHSASADGLRVEIAVRHTPPASEPELVVTSDALAALVHRLLGRARIAVDTEAASFHRYVDRVCLIQLSSDRETALIDPLAVEDLSPLGKLLADPDTEVVFHDADYDLRILHRDYKFKARNIFDTRIAAQLAGEPAVGLGSLLHKHFEVTLDKKFQRADWSRRPLTQEMIRYAADDTRFLPALRDELEQTLETQQRLDWAKEEFRLLEKIRWTGVASDGEAYLRVKGARSLTPRGLSVLRELHRWREDTARTLDRAPFRIVSNATLLTIAQQAPRSVKRLKSTHGVPSSVIRHYGPQLIDAVRAGLEIPTQQLPKLPRRSKPRPDPVYDRRLDRLKALRNRRAKEIGMEPGLLCPNGTLQAVARSAPTGAKDVTKIEGLRRWQKGVLGRDEILLAIRDPAGQ